jgi:TonB family protein
LRAYYAFGATSVVYNKLSRVQGLILPREVAIYDGERRVLTASVDSIEGISATAPELTPRGDATGTKEVRHITVASSVAQANLLKKVTPVYPQDAKVGRIQGTVILRATIGTDGRLHDLSVVDGPSASLVSASMWAVSQFQYKPYLLNGEPVEVDTTINVVFNLG